MIKNIIFDIGNVILDYNDERIVRCFTDDPKEQEILLEKILRSPEWLINGLIDTGYITREEMKDIIRDRTNHKYDELINRFMNHTFDYAKISFEVMDILKKLKEKGYNLYLLSNCSPPMYAFLAPSGLFEIVDGYVLSYRVHQIKPYEGIYKTLMKKYNLDPINCLFIDDRDENCQTAKKLGMKAELVKKNDYRSVENALNRRNISY